MESKRILSCLDSEDPLTFIADQVLMPVMEKIGTSWEEGIVSLAQVYISERICEEVVQEMFRPLTFTSDKKKHARLAIAAIEDWHSLGKQIIYSVLSASGYEVIDYGYGQTVTSIYERALRDEIEILLI